MDMIYHFCVSISTSFHELLGVDVDCVVFDCFFSF
jgi:hypothetical protein